MDATLESQIILWSAGVSGSDLAAFASVVAAIVAAGAAVLTNRSSTKAQVQVAQTTSRADIEANAFTRAEGIYQGVIDTLEGQVKTLEKDLADEKRERAEEVAVLREQLAAERQERLTETATLRRDLTAAKATIRALRPTTEWDPS